MRGPLPRAASLGQPGICWLGQTSLGLLIIPEQEAGLLPMLACRSLKGGKRMKWNNRLTVLGAKAQVQRFQKSTWNTALGARHRELLENSPCRFACEFKT